MALLILPFLALVLSLSPAKPSFSLPSSSSQHTRAAFISTGITCFGPILKPAFAFENSHSHQAAVAAATSTAVGVGKDNPSQSTKAVVYRPLSIDVDGVHVPVAAWYPSDDRDGGIITEGDTYYEHRISISKIGKYLAGWSLPSFLDRDFRLGPSLVNVKTLPPNEGGLPTSCPVVLLAHGFLGSRFDLSHLGESLASEGFLVLAPEYPESLAATYDVAQGTTTGIPIDRRIITDTLLKFLTAEWGVRPEAYGIVGHSLGCATVDGTGDEAWTRVCLAGGYPSLRGPNCLFVGSINDGAVPLIRAVGALRENDFEFLEERAVRSRSWNILPSRASLIFRNQINAPNHISFLAEGPNDAMVEFLSPLLPLARALGIPLLDFDKYQLSRDGKATGEVVIPLVVDYMKQKMKPIT
jgi:pimeloyl-ACP methyl ester carboxylesterase